MMQESSYYSKPLYFLGANVALKGKEIAGGLIGTGGIGGIVSVFVAERRKANNATKQTKLPLE